MIRTANPALNAGTFEGVSLARFGETQNVMTLQGTSIKTLVLAGCLLVTATYSWSLVMDPLGPSARLPVIIWGGAIGGLVMALVTIFKKTWAPVTAPIYALLEGLFLGGISALFEGMYQGIVIQAVGLTIGTLVALLFAYVSRIIKPTENFKLGVTAATGGIFLMYMFSWAMSMFGMQLGFIHNSGLLSIGISVFVIVIAALNLVLDFDFIEKGVEEGAPKYLEWYAAFGLMVTLIWLYIEILRLLSKIYGRR